MSIRKIGASLNTLDIDEKLQSMTIDSEGEGAPPPPSPDRGGARLKGV